MEFTVPTVDAPVRSGRFARMSPWPRITALALLAGGLACERVEQPAVRDTMPVRDSLSLSADTGDAEIEVDWRDENGPVLVIADDSVNAAILVLPALDTPRTSVSDVDSLQDLEVDLFGAGGRAGSARLRPRMTQPSGPDECAEWPTAQVVPRGSARGLRWNVGLAAGSAIALAMDSLWGLPRADSARLATEITKLASVTPSDTSPMFRGLPFRVQNAYRLTPSPGIVTVVATVVRTINQEANARTENLLIVAEQDRDKPGSKLTLRYFERVSGPEESTETIDVLAALLLGPQERPTIVLGRSDDSGTAFALLERSKAGAWTLQWSSPYTDC